MSRQNVYGVLSLEIDRECYLSSVDSQTIQPFTRVLDDKRKAVDEFYEAVAVSRDRGWSVLYLGPPLRG